MMFSIIMLSGCAQLLQTYVETVHKMGLTPAYDKARMDQMMAVQKGAPTVIQPMVKVPEGTPDGLFVTYFPNGQPRTKTIAKKGYMDEYLDIYYDNGQLRTHTPLVNGLAHGVSKSYLPNGQ